MSLYMADDVDFTAIADAIRTKTGQSISLIFPTQFINSLDLLMAPDDIILEKMRLRTITEISNIQASIVGSYAFCLCSSLSSVYLPNCQQINDRGFWNCSSLTTVSFPECLTIGPYAFYSDIHLTSAFFPKCTAIGSYAFCNNTRLTTISLPKCTTISSYAFQHCWSGLTTIDFPLCTNIQNNAFASCDNLISVNLPVCSILGNWAFGSCHKLTTVSLPKCKSLGGYAFYSCENLISLYLLSNSIVTLYNSTVFRSTPIEGYSTSAGRFGSIFVPANLLATYKSSRTWSYYSSRFVGI